MMRAGPLARIPPRYKKKGPRSGARHELRPKQNMEMLKSMMRTSVSKKDWTSVLLNKTDTNSSAYAAVGDSDDGTPPDTVPLRVLNHRRDTNLDRDESRDPARDGVDPNTSKEDLLNSVDC